MPGPNTIIQQLINRNPMLANNPNNKPILQALESNNAQQGQQLAENYVKTLGMDWNTAVQQARQFLNLP